MKLLLDENLAARVAPLLAAEGHDVLHVGDLGLLGAADEWVLEAASRERRVLVTADTDFGDLLALSGAALPSVLLLRRAGRRAEQRAKQILDAVQVAADSLESGALVVAEHSRVRIRDLPIDRGR